jgi:hypothetical protein
VVWASFGDFGIGIDEMQDSTPQISLILIFIFVVIVTLIMMNIFIGVVSMVYEKTEEESIIQFDQDLDQYMRDEKSESDRMWLKLVLMQNWEECLQRDVDEENKEQANAVAGLIKGQTKIMLQMERIIENAAKMERLVSNQQ